LTAGSAAEKAEGGKTLKYADLVASGGFTFMPAAIETLALGDHPPWILADDCADIGGRFAAESRDTRCYSFLLQRLSLAVQGGNAAAVIGTVPTSDNRGEY